MYIAMRQAEFLEEAIRKKREEMVSIGMVKGLQSKETIICSQELDNLMNEYHKVLINSKESRTVLDYHDILLTSA
ncbi:Spo0E family sporulation regulatory protein-aspartic acid phosphatase [Neobacillus sp.]|uniref:Aspartyl-phosphate phosphatase Spo0E family protein n=2 Tax=Neobacillus sedimentimangrovi TaxID=2699460 RepID=A0ABS8QEC9_9BACI|nr:aspartyl-phosphate phosphatase Spo0E family protein [Neobacillus sedimentimangrovi]